MSSVFCRVLSFLVGLQPETLAGPPTATTALRTNIRQLPSLPSNTRLPNALEAIHDLGHGGHVPLTMLTKSSQIPTTWRNLACSLFFNSSCRKIHQPHQTHAELPHGVLECVTSCSSPRLSCHWETIFTALPWYQAPRSLQIAQLVPCP